MVFVCPTKEETEAKVKLLNNLKNAMGEMEKTLQTGVSPICVPCCVPLADIPYPPPAVSKQKEKTEGEFCPPNVMVCYKICQKDTKPEAKVKQESEVVHRLHQSKSRELRASILYTGCYCEKKDGLQDDCPRTGCHGSPECLTQPPSCGPSEFCNGKHLGKKGYGSKYLGKGEEEGNGKKGGKAKYKCFPAVIQAPVCSCPLN
nr:unnamed protein product [Callosobruchus chinensis]